MPPEMEDMADAAGDAALEAYQTALDGGADPSEAAGRGGSERVSQGAWSWSLAI